jgi:putative tryptophan/tyrosine transport system substrate-binding protein
MAAFEIKFLPFSCAGFNLLSCKDLMRRREFIGLLGGVVAELPFSLAAQSPVRQIGILTPFSESAGRSLEDCFQEALGQLGWLEGQKLEFEYKRFEGNTEQIAPFAEELVRLRPDVILAVGTPSAQTLQRATSELAVVFVAVSNPVASGIVASLASPERNVTGVSNFLPATTGKLLELLNLAAPVLQRVVVLRDVNNYGKTLEVRELQSVGQTLNIRIDPIELRTSDDVESAFAAAGSCPTA